MKNFNGLKKENNSTDFDRLIDKGLNFYKLKWAAL